MNPIKSNENNKIPNDFLICKSTFVWNTYSCTAAILHVKKYLSDCKNLTLVIK